MGVSVFPAASTGGGAALPQGATANVASGYANSGGWKYSTSTPAGTYQVTVQAPSNQIYGIETANGVVVSEIEGGQTVPLKLNSTEASITVGSYYPFRATQVTSINSTIRNINSGNGLHILTTETNYLYTSTDGITWTNRTTGSEGTSSSHNIPGYVNDRWVVPGWTTNGSNYGVLHSTNGTTWTFQDISTLGAPPLQFAYGNGTWVVTCAASSTSTSVATSTNFTTWTNRTTPATNVPRSIVYGNYDGVNMFVLGCSGGLIWYSTDNGASWTSATTTNAGNDINSIVLANGRLTVFGLMSINATTSGAIFTSHNTGSGAPTSWLTNSIGNQYNYSATIGRGAYFLGTYFAVTNSTALADVTSTVPSGTVVNLIKCLTSRDGFTWTVRGIARGLSGLGQDMNHGNGVLIIGYTNKTYWTSAFNSAAIHINSTALASV